jgi:hypothetical protein
MTPTSWAAVVRSLSGAAGPSLQPDKADASNTATAAPENEESNEKDKGRGAAFGVFPRQPGSPILPILLRAPGLRDLKSAASRASLVIHDMAFFSFVEGAVGTQWVRPAPGGRAGRARLRVVGQGKGNPGPLSFVNSPRYPAPGTPAHAFSK